MERSASGPTWAIATPHEEATRAGADAFERGGNAVDAALRAATVLAVAYPHMCGVGGDLFALVQRPDGETLAVSSSGRSPAAADRSAIRSVDHAMPIRGPEPITVPGAVAGWRALHGTGAVLPWADAFSRAIELAIDGVPVARSLAETLAGLDEPFGADPGLSAIFFADGIPSPPGTTVRQGALGTTLTAIAHDGPEALYGGPMARPTSPGSTPPAHRSRSRIWRTTARSSCRRSARRSATFTSRSFRRTRRGSCCSRSSRCWNDSGSTPTLTVPRPAPSPSSSPRPPGTATGISRTPIT